MRKKGLEGKAVDLLLHMGADFDYPAFGQGQGAAQGKGGGKGGGKKGGK